MSKRPSFQFYPGDWLKDPSLRSCSPATRGIWIDLLCAIHEIGDGGAVSGTIEQLARMTGCFPEEMRSAIDELSVTLTANVTERNKKVTVVCRRMETQAKALSDNALRQKRHREQRASNEKVTPPSSSSSSFKKEHTPDGVSKKAGSRIPDPFMLTAEMRAYAADRRPDVDVELETEKFVNFWRAKTGRDATKLDWAATWRNWILNAKGPPAGHPPERRTETAPGHFVADLDELQRLKDSYPGMPLPKRGAGEAA